MPIMLYFLIFILAFACSAQGVIVERKLDDGYIPSGTTNPSTVKDCKYWVNFQSGLLGEETLCHCIFADIRGVGDTCFKYTEIYGITAKDLIKLVLLNVYSRCLYPDIGAESFPQ